MPPCKEQLSTSLPTRPLPTELPSSQPPARARACPVCFDDFEHDFEEIFLHFHGHGDGCHLLCWRQLIWRSSRCPFCRRKYEIGHDLFVTASRTIVASLRVPNDALELEAYRSRWDLPELPHHRFLYANDVIRHDFPPYHEPPVRDPEPNEDIRDESEDIGDPENSASNDSEHDTA